MNQLRPLARQVGTKPMGNQTHRIGAVAILVCLALAGAGCGLPLSDLAGMPGGSGAPAPAPQTARQADPRDAARLSRLMVPLLRAADKPRAVDSVRVALVDSAEINAASAGQGRFIVTRGLLDRATDEQLLAILAHEVAHDDLGHVARAQTRETGIALGTAILGEIFPATGQIAPIAGTLITRAYSRSEELEADRHGAELLRRVGSSKAALERTLVWLRTTGGGGGGGFLSTHPATDERIEALRRMP